jgi:hypothetical protein
VAEVSRHAALLMEFALQQAVARLPDKDFSRTDKEQSLSNLRAGASGEKRIYEAVRSILLPEGVVLIQNLSLPLLGGAQFQMDLVIVAKSGILLIESKQIAGRLRFNTVPAELRKVDESGGILAVYDCPIAQLSDQKENLRQWLLMEGYQVPVLGAVVFANTPIIEEIGQDAPVYKLREVRNLVRRHLERKPVIGDEDILAISKTMKAHGQSYLPFPLRHSNQSAYFIGPICRYCRKPLKKRSKRTWHCDGCSLSDGDPYLSTLLAWFLLVRKTIHPREVMDMFGLKAHKSVRNLMTELPFEKIGSGKATGYQADYRRLSSTEGVTDLIGEWLATEEEKETV